MAPKRGRGGAKGAVGHADRVPQLPSYEELSIHGPKPETPDELFVAQGLNLHRVRKEQLVSLRLTSDPELAECARSITGREPLIVNAGTPTPDNPSAATRFHGHAFVPRLDETNEVEWRGGPWAKQYLRIGNGAAEEKPLTRHVSDHRYCSPADVLARHVGGKALAPGGKALFVTVFLSEGVSAFPREPDCATPEWHEWSALRQVIGQNLCKLLLVYPKTVPPVYCKDAGPCMLACLASIRSDKTAGAPGATYQSSIAGYHDRSRLHVLPLGHVQRIRELVSQFRLGELFPALQADDGVDKRSPPVVPAIVDWMPLMHYRTSAIAGLGPPRGGVVTPEWVAQRGDVPFDTPWVQHCSMEYPSGKWLPDGKPLLVPLVLGSPEERNGTPWLRLDPEDAASVHHQQVSAVFKALVARGEPDETAQAATPGDHGEAALPEAKKLRAEVDALRVENAKLQARLDKRQCELDAAKRQSAELAGQVHKLTRCNLDLSAALSARSADIANVADH